MVTRTIHRLTAPLVLLMLLLAPAALAGWDPDLATKAGQAVAEFKKADPSLKRFFKSAYGYAVFPTVGQGGAYGSGVVYRDGKVIGETSLTQLTIGFQLGGQAYREIIFFRNQATLEAFKRGNFELSAQASAVAATYGASADADFENGVAVFTLAKGGLMYEASIGGQKFDYDAL